MPSAIEPTQHLSAIKRASMIHISLFSGIGGFELAAEWMGWRNYVSCDINEFGNRVRKHYWANCYTHTDIKTLTYEIINEELSARYGSDWRNDDIIVTGGFPCQPYSSAGKRLGKADERHLFPEMLRVISEIKPTYIVGENVYGLTNWSEGLVFEEVCAELEGIGYEVQPILLPASGIGAPHHRMRVWFVAYANGNESQSNAGANAKETSNLRREDEGDVLGEFCGDGDAADTNCGRLEGATEIGRDCEYVIGQGIFGNAADSDCKGSQERSLTKWDDTHEWQEPGRPVEQSASNAWKTYSADWNGFPSVEPTIRSRDDGFSHRLDGITFSKWRQQSIMAYGNAVVPQLVYQVFKAIDDTHRTHPSSPRPQDV